MLQKLQTNDESNSILYSKIIMSHIDGHSLLA